MRRCASIAVLGVVVGCGHGTPPPAPRPVLPPPTCTGLCGRAVWPDGNPAYGVSVVIARDGAEEVRVTGDDGVFDFAEAPVGSYALVIYQGMRRMPDVAVRRTATGPQRLADVELPYPVACTLLGCDDGLAINLRSKSKRWPEGSYVFRVVADDETVECKASIPHGACGALDLVVCAPNEHRVSITTGACSQRQAFDIIRVAKPATTIDVDVRRDGASLGHATYRPTYEVVRPNGPEPECGSCKDAGEVTLDVAW